MRTALINQSTTLASLIAVSCAGAFAIGCGSDAEIEATFSAQPVDQQSSGSPSGNTAAARYLEITVRELAVHVADSGSDVDEDHGPAGKEDSSGGGWSTVYEGSTRLNLLDATATEQFVGSNVVPAGKITQLRLILADDATLVDGGERLSVTCPSCTQTGIKIVTSGGLKRPRARRCI